MCDIPYKVDKRLDFIYAIICSYVIKNGYKNKDEFDWVEFPNTKYFNDLVSKIRFDKFPELEKYLLDIKDEGYYNYIVYLFNDDFSIKYQDIDKVQNPFKNESLKEYLELLRRIYLSFDMNKILEDNKGELKLQQECLGKLPDDYNKAYVLGFFGSLDDIDLSISCSIFMNGGFSSTIGNHVYCTRGIKYKDGEFFVNRRYNFISINHEFAHHFINPIVDKYYDKVSDYDYLFKEAKANGLPGDYSGMNKTILYEYFVRAASVVMSEKWISQEEMQPDFLWFKKIGFIRIEEITDIIRENLINYSSFEELYINVLIPYLNSFTRRNNEEMKNSK